MEITRDGKCRNSIGLYVIQGLYRDNGRENLNSLKVGYIHNNCSICRPQVARRTCHDFHSVLAALTWHHVPSRRMQGCQRLGLGVLGRLLGVKTPRSIKHPQDLTPVTSGLLLRAGQLVSNRTLRDKREFEVPMTFITCASRMSIWLRFLVSGKTGQTIKSFDC